MTHIRRLRIVLPARMARIAPHAARDLAERLVQTAPAEALASGTIRLTDTGQSAGMFGAEAGRMLAAKGEAK